MAAKVLCGCCNKLVSRKVERAHRVHARHPYSYLSQSGLNTKPKLRGVSSPSPSASSLEDGLDDFHAVEDGSTSLGVGPSSILYTYAENVNYTAQAPDEDSESNSSHSDEEDTVGEEDPGHDLLEDDEEYPDWETFEYPSREPGISAWDSLGEAYEQEAAAVGESDFHALQKLMFS